MIRMINGSTRIGLNLYNAASGPFVTDEATEKRLVSLGAAEYVAETPPTPAETGAPAAGSSGAGNDNPDTENGTAGQETPEDGTAYADMKAPALRNLMKERGLPCKVGIKNAEMIAALEAYDKEHAAAEPLADGADGGANAEGVEDEEPPTEDEESVEDGEQPPELDTGDIVV